MRVCAILCAVLLAGCTQPRKKETERKFVRPPVKPKYEGPPVRVEIEVQPSYPEQYAATCEVHVPTGGFQLRSDRATIRSGRLMWYLTLVAPGDDAEVAQAEMKLVHKHDTGSERFLSVEVWIKRFRKGEYSAPRYLLAASARQ